jgi:hypothetical protein
MRVVVPEPELRKLLGSEARLRRRWPDGHQDVMLLIHVLRVSGETLLDTMLSGLITINTSQDAAVLGGLSLSHRRAHLSGIAWGEGDAPATAPHAHAARVQGIEVLDLVVADITAERRVG